MPFALNLIPWRLVAVIGLAAGLFFGAMYIVGTIKRAATMEALMKTSVAMANANAEVAKSQAATAKRIDAVATVAAINKAKIRAKSDARRKDIIHAPAAQDAPLAPVLREQLDRLPIPDGANEGDDTRAPGDPSGAPVANARPVTAAGQRHPARRRARARGFHGSFGILQRGQSRYPLHLGGVRTWKPSTA